MSTTLLPTPLGCSSIGLLFGAVIGILLASTRKENGGEQTFSGSTPFGLAILGLCAFVALATIFLAARRV